MESFRAFGLLSRWEGPPSEASRPFDALRTGLVVAEGAAIVAIEREDHARDRGAKIYARILGWGGATEGASGMQVERSGESTARCIRQALGHADTSPEEIDYISAHGNSIPEHDAAETLGIKLAFGPRAWSIPTSSFKSMCGQAFAASSAMQVVAACLTLHHGMITPTINHAVADPTCDLDYVPNTARRARIRTALLHVRSIGGSHTALILGNPNETDR
jgi:3-oxoacyl-[acyl-carrier-protein] synthase II